MRIICIGHKAPSFRPGLPYVLISPRRIEGHPSIVIPDDHLGQMFDGGVLSEYTQLFTLADKLESERSDDPLYLFQYRKFLSVREPSRRSTNLSFAFVTTPEEAESFFPRPDEMAALAEGGLAGPWYRGRPLADQYSQQHPPQDLIAFCLALAELEQFDRERVKRFVHCPVLLPSPGMGVFQPPTFVRHMQVLRAAWRVFHEHYYIPREGYQRRVGGFLLERLHSFLIYEEVLNPTDTPIFEGYHVIVSDTAHVGGTI